MGEDNSPELAPAPPAPQIRPYQEYSKVFLAKRAPEYQDEQIDEDTITQTCALVREKLRLLDNDFENPLVERDDKKKLILSHSAELLGTSISELEDRPKNAPQEKIPAGQKWMLEAFLQSGDMIADIQTRWDRSNERNNAMIERKKAIDREVNELNVKSVTWQNKVVRMLYNFRLVPEGKEYAKMFWDHFSKCGATMISSENEDFDGLKRGLMGQIAAIDTMESLGWKAYFPIAEQDALEKVDLWLQHGQETAAVQIKNRRGNYVFRCDKLEKKEDISLAETDEERKDIATRNRLLTATQNYNTIWKPEKAQVSAYWLELPEVGIDFDQDQLTGVTTTTSGFKKSRVAQKMTRGGMIA